MLACGGAEEVQVGVRGLPPAMPAPSEPATRFQGAVASIDAAAGSVVVDVQLVWTPVLKAERHERRVRIDAGTRWEPASVGLAGLRVGEEVQVESAEAVDGVWPALRVQLFDID
jgi:hypothetical protein